LYLYFTLFYFSVLAIELGNHVVSKQGIPMAAGSSIFSHCISPGAQAPLLLGYFHVLKASQPHLSVFLNPICAIT
jgi:hypothetical protein